MTKEDPLDQLHTNAPSRLSSKEIYTNDDCDDDEAMVHFYIENEHTIEVKGKTKRCNIEEALARLECLCDHVPYIAYTLYKERFTGTNIDMTGQLQGASCVEHKK